MGHQVGVGASGSMSASKMVVDAFAAHSMWIYALNKEFTKRVARKQGTESCATPRDESAPSKDPGSEEGIARRLAILSVLRPEGMLPKSPGGRNGPCKLVRTLPFASWVDPSSEKAFKYGDLWETATASPGMYQSMPASPVRDDVADEPAPDPEAQWLSSRPPMLKRQGGMPELQAFVKRSRR